jgi:hypothetical protein
VGAVVSAADLQRLAQEKAFEPTQRFAELPADHVPHTELGGEDVEARVLEMVTYEEPRVAIVWAPPGAGKSSVIATVGESLASGFLLLQIPVWGLPDETVRSAPELGRHVLAQVDALLGSHLQAHQRERIGQGRVLKRTRQSGGIGASAGSACRSRDWTQTSRSSCGQRPSRSRSRLMPAPCTAAWKACAGSSSIGASSRCS